MSLDSKTTLTKRPAITSSLIIEIHSEGLVQWLVGVTLN